MVTHSIRQFPLHFPSRTSVCAIIFQLDSTSAVVTVVSSSQRLSRVRLVIHVRHKYEVSHNNLITDFKILSTQTFPFTNSKFLGRVHSLYWKVSQATAKRQTGPVWYACYEQLHFMNEACNTSRYCISCSWNKPDCVKMVLWVLYYGQCFKKS